MRAPRVLVVGDVINDILVEPAGPVTAGEDNPAAIRARPGGSAANQAAWLSSLGVAVTFAGRAGASDAERHRAELAGFGVRAELAADADAPTGSVVVVVEPGGERTMITDRGANLRLTAADVPPRLLDGADLLHLTGYSLFDPGPRAVALELIACARERSIPFSLDPGSAAFLLALAPGEFLSWTRGAAACFPNLDEAQVLAGGPLPPEQLAAALTGHYATVALKLGPDGAVLAAGGQLASFPARSATVRDTTGAGDAFCAGFLAAWLRGSGAPGAVQAGLESAAQAVSVLGGRPACLKVLGPLKVQVSGQPPLPGALSGQRGQALDCHGLTRRSRQGPSSTKLRARSWPTRVPRSARG